MPLHHPRPRRRRRDHRDQPPLCPGGRDPGSPEAPLAHGELSPDTAYQVVHDELMLDGNARLNLATFVTTWMDPQARRLMNESLDKNAIDKDEYHRPRSSNAVASTCSPGSGMPRSACRGGLLHHTARAKPRCSRDSR